MKPITAILLLLAINVRAQFYLLSTNLTSTNFIAASATTTYAGANTLDVRRYRSIGITVGFYGSDTNTNTVAFTYKVGATNTGYEILPPITVSATSYGTNYSEVTSNIQVINFGYIKPFQIINSCTNDLTNAFQFGQIKVFPQN